MFHDYHASFFNRGDMTKLLTLDNLQQHFEEARQKISRDRIGIITAAPLPPDFNRSEYGFAYRRAERIGMAAIDEALREVAWLPLRLDPQSEIMLDNRDGIKRWLGNPDKGQPDGNDFGNDFIHALTRSGLTQGWNSPEYRWLALRIGEFFHDLSCLIGLIYYGVWLAENGIAGLPLTNPEDLERTTKEIAALTRSPAVMEMLKKRNQPAAVKPPRDSKAKKKSRPVLSVIDNARGSVPEHAGT